jgi:hypothetical protein
LRQHKRLYAATQQSQIECKFLVSQCYASQVVDAVYLTRTLCRCWTGVALHAGNASAAAATAASISAAVLCGTLFVIKHTSKSSESSTKQRTLLPLLYRTANHSNTTVPTAQCKDALQRRQSSSCLQMRAINVAAAPLFSLLQPAT